MALYGIIADIHGNLEALAAATTFLEARGVERILCLGDIVGYNADPNACIVAMRSLSMIAVAGNHDLIAAGLMGTERCSAIAAYALTRTRRTLSRESREAISALPAARVVEDDLVLVHGGVADVCQYVSTPERVEENDALLRRFFRKARVCFHGHTHAARVHAVQRGVASTEWSGEAPLADDAEAGAGEPLLLDASGRTYFVNPGSIDAARKSGERFAELAVFDSARRALWLHRVAYDHAESERRAAAGGYRMTGALGRLFGAAHGLRRRERAVLQRLLSGARRWRGAASPAGEGG